MDTFVLITILFAAFLHALWNTIAKKNDDKRRAVLAVVLGHIPFALVAMIFSPQPNYDAVYYVIIGALLHTGYQFSLTLAYQKGDLSVVYPISRGFAPVLAAFALFVIWGETLSPPQTLAMVIVCIGVLSFAFVGGSSGAISSNGIKFSLLTALFIASYSVIDGLGARIAGTSLGFYAYLTILNAVSFTLLNEWKTPGITKGTLKSHKTAFWLGGFASFSAYALVIWSFTQAPIALVTAVRETSIVIALFFGAFILKERIQIRKIISTFITVSGVILLRLTK